MRQSRALALLLAVTVGAFLTLDGRLAAPATGLETAATAGDIASSPPPTPSPPTSQPGPDGQEPPGIEAPLGRYEEPPSPAGEGAALAPGLLTAAPPIMTGFAGIGMEPDSDGFIHSPPDTHAAAGLYRIVEVTNGHVAIYDKSGTLIAGGDSGFGAVDLDAFCESSFCFDPKVIYDQGSNRFVAVALEGTSSTFSFMHVMVSKTATPSSFTTASWDKFRLDATATIGSSTGWFDYPGLGVSPDAVVVTGNIFPTVGSILGTKIRVFDKAELYDHDAVATFTDIDTSFAVGGATIQPVHHFGSPPAGTFYLFQRWNATYLHVWALTGVPGSPTVNQVFLLTPTDQGKCVDNVPQMGTSKRLDTVCPRMMNAVWRDGSLWGALTGSDAADSRAIVQWFEVATNGYPPMLPTLLQHGAIDGGAGEHTFMPSISVDACGNAGVTYTQSSDVRWPEMRYTGRLATDPPNAMQTPDVAKTSVSFYDDFTGNTPPSFEERWGDFSATTIDPVDQSFWIANEYARVAASGGGNNGRWGTWISNFDLGCFLDADGDGVSDAIDNCISVPNGGQENTDSDPIPNGADITGSDSRANPDKDAEGDVCDTDDDNDGPDANDDLYTDAEEAIGCGSGPTDPLNKDTDGDGAIDGYECKMGTDPNNPADKPMCTNLADTDGDGFKDCLEEMAYGTSPLSTDTDGDSSGNDGCQDDKQIVDANDDGQANALDVAAIARIVFLPGPWDPVSLAVADLNKDGADNILDVGLSALNSALVESHLLCE